MRIPSNKPTFIDAPKSRDKTAVESPGKTADSATVSRSSDAATTSASLDQTVQDTDMAAREFEKTISARLTEVKEQLRAGTYAVDFERLARRMMEDGFGS
jgi:anti-sigma28 factor (negative regulator of flagellin synthesis)